MKSAGASSSHRATAFAAGLAISSVALALWAYGYLAGEKDAAMAGTAEVAECRALAGRIETLRQRSSKQGTASGEKGELIRRITTAALAAGFDDGALDRIEPETQRSNGETSKGAEQARVYLKNVNLRQVVAFLHDLDSSGSLSVVRIRFVAPANAKSGGDDSTGGPANTWAVEATVRRGAGGGFPQAARAAVRP